MKLYSDKLTAYNKSLHNFKDPITSQSKLIDRLTMLPKCASIETARDKIIKFGQCMYYCAGYHYNPAIAYSGNQENIYDRPMLYVHELMHRFLTERGFMRIPACTGLGDSLINSDIKWNVPQQFSPILTTYILSMPSRERKKPCSFEEFFDRFDKLLPKVIPILSSDKSDLIEQDVTIYHEWKDEFLGYKYLFTCNAIYKKYASNPDLKEAIHSCIGYLTDMVLECTNRPNILTTYATQLITIFQNRIASKIKSVVTDEEKDAVLYDVMEPFYIDKELKYLQAFFQKFHNAYEEFCSTITSSSPKDYQQRHPDEFFIKYPALLYNEFAAFRSVLNEFIASFNIAYFEFAAAIAKDPDIKSAVKNPFWSYENRREHSIYFTNFFACYAQEITERISAFLRNITEIYGPQQPQYDKPVVITKEEFSELCNHIKSLQESYTKRIEKSLKKLPPILYNKKPGYFSTIPKYDGSLDSISHILDLLAAENKYAVPDQGIIPFLQSKKIILAETKGVTKELFYWLLLHFETLLRL